MWPFDYRKRKYDRRYKAALVILLSEYMYARLDARQRAQVEAEMNQNFNRSDTPAAAWRRLQWDIISAFRAAAMERLGIEPTIPGLTWVELFRPWAHWRKWPQWPVTPGFDILPSWLVADFRPMDRATADAEAFLREFKERGADAPVAV
jgi:hypothetical protein